jgi:hypothetical protein
MRAEYYSQFVGIKRATHQPDAPQVSALVLDNFIPNRYAGTYVKRGGSTVWSQSGDILGIFGYTDASNSYRTPYTQWVLRHRRLGGASFIEKLDWASSTWMALTQGGNLSFSALGIMDAAQFGSWLILTGGRPAKLTGPSATVTRLGGPAPTTAPTWTLAAGALSGETIGYYTFYDSTSGWESSPSPFTALTTLASQKITWSALETTAFRDGVDKKRLYRSQLGASGAAPYYRVTEVSLATTSYVDTATDLDLGTFGPDIGDNDPPPEDSFIVEQYANCIWIAKDNELWYSKTYDGSMSKLEYYSQSIESFAFRSASPDSPTRRCSVDSLSFSRLATASCTSPVEARAPSSRMSLRDRLTVRTIAHRLLFTKTWFRTGAQTVLRLSPPRES